MHNTVKRTLSNDNIVRKDGWNLFDALVVSKNNTVYIFSINNERTAGKEKQLPLHIGIMRKVELG